MKMTRRAFLLGSAAVAAFAALPSLPSTVSNGIAVAVAERRWEEISIIYNMDAIYGEPSYESKTMPPEVKAELLDQMHAEARARAKRLFKDYDCLWIPGCVRDKNDPLGQRALAALKVKAL